MEPVVIDGVDGLRAAVGKEFGPSDWLEITQERINLFAEATGDFQWIHVDPERAATQSPFGRTIAHGYLTLSLISQLVPQIVRVEGFSFGLNYGANKVRFPAPVPVGSRVRARSLLKELADVPGGVQMIMVTTVDVEDNPKPACVVESVSRFLA